jgi:hypothetical protein
MNIDPIEITVRELTEGFTDNNEGGVVGYGENLDIRPPYQREFVYKDKQRDAVIDTLFKGYPLNVMYWAVRDEAAAAETQRGYELMDGQQRTISICQFVAGNFSYKGRYFNNLQTDEKLRVLDYKLTVYVCSGPDSEKLEWFRTINIAGEKLTDQELRNAVYSGTWVSDAKRYFSKTNGPAIGVGGDYVSGTPNRQEVLETAIEWINNGDVENYMAVHQHDLNAQPLWLYYNAVMTWAKTNFPVKRAQLKTVPWGSLYNVYKDAALDATQLEARVKMLMKDDEVQKKSGIYAYVLTGDEKALTLRQFTDNQKVEAYERQDGICAVCGEKFALSEMEADHIDPWHSGGKTVADNCQMLCRPDNRRKGGI